jgi:single-strand DNA-binding protein
MDYQQNINRVELQGTVGSVKVSTIAGKEFIRFTVATNMAFRDRRGEAVIETTWHTCSAREGKGICPFGEITKGAAVHLTGRLRASKYVGMDGTERSVVDIFVETLNTVKPL